MIFIPFVTIRLDTYQASAQKEYSGGNSLARAWGAGVRQG